MPQYWLSAHLYYNEPWETFLTEAVNPYIQSVLKTGIAQSYFFVRYWEKGPHIRLRFRGESSELQEVLKPNLVEHFSAYFDVNPSERTEPEYPKGFPSEYLWLPNNSIRFEKYEQEYKRYGGNKGIALAEEQFQISSDTVLDYFDKDAETDAHSYHEVLGAAIRLHLSFAYSIGLENQEMVSFFEMIFENWLPKAFEIFEDNAPDNQIIGKMRETVGLFSDSFESQKEDLIPFHSSLLNDLKSGEDFDSATFNKWIKENQRLSLKLSEVAETGILSTRTDPYIMSESLSKKLSESDQLLWNIFADYVHMTNNRLGILNQDEAYLAYLIMKSLKEIAI